jgi:hypothetical protein
MRACYVAAVLLLASGACGDSTETPVADLGPGSDTGPGADSFEPGQDGDLTELDGTSPPATYWLNQVQGPGSAVAQAISVDDEDETVVAGRFTLTVNVGTFGLTSFGDEDIFVAKYLPSGDALWAVSGGGVLKDSPGWGIATDDRADVYVVGQTEGDVTFGEETATTRGVDCLIAKLNGTSGETEWIQTFGGDQADMCWDVAIGPAGGVFLTGELRGTVDFGGTSLTAEGDADAFVAKLDASGDVTWATAIGDVERDKANGVAVGPQGAVYAIGVFRGQVSLSSGTLVAEGDRDVFVAKLDGASGAVTWAQGFGGSGYDSGDRIAVGSQGEVFAASRFKDQATYGSRSLTASGTFDVAVVELSAADGTVEWIQKISASADEAVWGIAGTPAGDVVIAGEFTGELATLQSQGLTDVFVARMNGGSGAIQWAASTGGGGIDRAWALALDARGDAVITGAFQETVTFGDNTLTAEADTDAFVWKLPVE